MHRRSLRKGGCEEERGGIVREVTTHGRSLRKGGGQDAVEGNGAAPSSHPLSRFISQLCTGKSRISEDAASIKNLC